MIATIISERKKHYPVLLSEIISIITPQYGGTFIDCTFGQGGYTKKILEYPKSKVIALDRDKDSEKISALIKKKFKDRFVFENKKFSQINELNLKKENIKSIIFDLGGVLIDWNPEYVYLNVFNGNKKKMNVDCFVR